MEKSRLCMLCCCSYRQEPFSNVCAAMVRKAHFTKFCKELECVFVEKKIKGGNNSQRWKEQERILLTGDLNLNYRKVSICPDCLGTISSANEFRVEMGKVEDRVRNLQRQLLEALKKMKDFIAQFYIKMKSIEHIIKTSDEPCLRNYLDEHLTGEQVQDVLKFRQSILDAVLNLPSYQQQLDDKTCCETTMERLEEERRTVVKTSKPDSKEGNICTTSTTPAQPATFPYCETDDFHDNDDVEVDIANEYENNTSTVPERRPARPIRRTTVVNRRVVKESDEEEDGDNVSEVGSNFSDADPDFKQFKETEKVKSRSKIDFSGMSEFRKKIVKSVVAKLKRTEQKNKSESDDDTSTDDDSDYSDEGLAKNKAEIMKKKKKCTRKAEARVESDPNDDPRKKYPVQFNVETQTLSVNGIEIIVNDDENSAKCSLCSYTYYETEAKRNHGAVESDIQEHIIGSHIGEYKCKVCEKNFSSYIKYKRHMLTHQNKQLFNCHICGKPFRNNKNVKQHQWYHMSKEEQEVAMKNGTKDPTKGWRELKSRPRNMPCPTCGMAFRTLYALKQHELRLHDTDRERVMCQNCGKMLLSGPSLQYHELICQKGDADSGEVSECHVCLKVFKNKVILRKHFRRYHSKTSPQGKSFICSQCGKGFRFQVNLNFHAAVHSNDRPFRCEWCNVSYKWKKHLKRHQATCTAKT